jgi:hypothetical protein
MTTEIFVQSIKAITKSAISGLLNSFKTPPGRRPTPDIMRICSLFKKLSEEDKQTFTVALELAAKQSVCNVFLVLDGALSISSTEEKGELELFYNNGKTRVRINGRDNVMLNEIFRQH